MGYPGVTLLGIAGRQVFIALIILYWGSEWLLSLRMRAGRGDRIEDRGSLRWISIAFPLAWVGAIVLGGVRPATYGTVATFSAGLAVMVVGQILRWWSMATLGRLFTINVAIRSGHHVIESGPYRYVRHPSYSAILLVHIGAALCFGNALSGIALLVPVAASLAYRMRVEEQLLCAALGTAYQQYMARTKRLVPGLY